MRLLKQGTLVKDSPTGYVGAKGTCSDCGTEIELEINDYKLPSFHRGRTNRLTGFNCPTCGAIIGCSKEEESKPHNLQEGQPMNTAAKEPAQKSNKYQAFIQCSMTGYLYFEAENVSDAGHKLNEALKGKSMAEVSVMLSSPSIQTNEVITSFD